MPRTPWTPSTWLCALLLALLTVMASGPVSAKLASGPQQPGLGLHPGQSLFNLLPCQGKSVSSTTGALECSVVPKGTGTVFDSIKATQATIKGTSIPKSFELASEGGKFWVHPNATKHMAEYLTRNGLSHSTFVGSQAMLKSFQQSVNQAASQGIKYGEMMQVGRWELIFSKGRAGDALPVIKHALYK